MTESHTAPIPPMGEYFKRVHIASNRYNVVCGKCEDTLGPFDSPPTDAFFVSHGVEHIEWLDSSGKLIGVSDITDKYD